MLYHFLEKKNLSVSDTDTTAKASCESAVGRVVQSLMYLRKNLVSLLVNNSSIINSNFILKSLQSLVPTKVHDVGVKMKSTTVDKLTPFLDFIESQTKLNKRCWPGSFFKLLQSDKSKKLGSPFLTWKRLLWNLHSKQYSSSISSQLERQ